MKKGIEARWVRAVSIPESFGTPHEHTLCGWRAVVPRFSKQFTLCKPCLFHHFQEILSRYGTTLSPGPASKDGLFVLGWVGCEHLVGNHETPIGLQHPEHFLERFQFFRYEVEGSV